MKQFTLTLIFLLVSSAHAIEPLSFADGDQEVRYQELIEELRCLVCQNQNLADSDAPLAADLRAEVYGMLSQGQSDEQIVTFLVERYGDFVLYRPPVQKNTLLLWVGPALFFLLAVAAVAMRVRHGMNTQGRESDADLDAALEEIEADEP